MIVGMKADGRNGGNTDIPENDGHHIFLARYPMIENKTWYIEMDFISEAPHEHWHVWVMFIRKNWVSDQVKTWGQKHYELYPNNN